MYKLSRTLTPWLFLIPAILFLLVFSVYPFIETIVLSLMTSERGILTFSGLSNYKRLITDQYFFASLKNSLIYLFIQVPFMIMLSIVLAVMLNTVITKCKGVFRTAFFMPIVVESVAYSLIFVLLFQNEGVVNFLLSIFGLNRVPWLSSSWPARFLIMIIITWRWTGYNMVIMLAGLQAISNDYYEAATIDGANFFQKFMKITLPMLKPVIIFSAILSTIGTLNLFTEPYLLTEGGPNNATLSTGLYIYRQAFRSLNLTYASTISISILVIVGFLSRLQFIIGKDK